MFSLVFILIIFILLTLKLEIRQMICESDFLFGQIKEGHRICVAPPCLRPLALAILDTSVPLEESNGVKRFKTKYFLKVLSTKGIFWWIWKGEMNYIAYLPIQ